MLIIMLFSFLLREYVCFEELHDRRGGMLIEDTFFKREVCLTKERR